MIIERLQAEHVGPFKSLDVTFNPHMNVIVGVNGVGKTSMLRCITYCLSNNNLEDLRFYKDASFKLTCEQNGRQILYGVDQLVSKDQGYRHCSPERYNLNHQENIENKSIIEGHQYNLLAIGAYRYISYSLIDGMKREAPISDRRKEYARNNARYIENASMPNIKQWMINRYFQIEKDWAKVEKANWNKIIKQIPKISPYETCLKLERIERDLEPIFSVNGIECYLEELSSGFKSVLSIIFMIVDWIEGINERGNAKIDEAEGTVLIDEIDAHLHPSWQATILGALRSIFPKLQFIVTTHSPNVLMSANSGEVILFTNNDGVVKEQPVDKSYGAWLISDVMTDVMQTPNVDRVSIYDLLEELDMAFQTNSKTKFKNRLEKLKHILSPSDTILKVYNIKLAQLQLNHDKAE